MPAGYVVVIPRPHAPQRTIPWQSARPSRSGRAPWWVQCAATRSRLARYISQLIYDRKTLYDQVWSQPVQVVAKSYGVSGVALGKTCRRLQIPVPPRGYWARIRTGQKVKRPPLPEVR